MKSLRVFLFILKCTFIGFGGGNALMPVIKKEAVDKHKWLTLKEFDNLVISTNMIPGPSVVEALSFVAIKQLGKIKGAIITLLAVLPHVMMALGLFIIADRFLPKAYLIVLSASVMPVIVGILIAFGLRYIKASNKQIYLPVWLAIFVFTLAFTLFIPAPYNIPAIVMIFVIVIVFLISFFKEKRKTNQNQNKEDK